MRQNAASRARAAAARLSAATARVRPLAMAGPLLPVDDMLPGPVVALPAPAAAGQTEVSLKLHTALASAAARVEALATRPFARKSLVSGPGFMLTAPQVDIL